ncbi:hypothetical protein KM043_017183 [Ampulex compressa]|nr:hypothetical protein KM043_017183 [Ampulex compressa]
MGDDSQPVTPVADLDDFHGVDACQGTGEATRSSVGGVARCGIAARGGVGSPRQAHAQALRLPCLLDAASAGGRGA